VRERLTRSHWTQKPRGSPTDHMSAWPVSTRVTARPITTLILFDPCYDRWHAHGLSLKKARAFLSWLSNSPTLVMASFVSWHALPHVRVEPSE
jgi:hypothetical protein